MHVYVDQFYVRVQSQKLCWTLWSHGETLCMYAIF